MSVWRLVVLAINVATVVCFLVSWLRPRLRTAAASLDALMEEHETNMRSGDPAVVAEATRRWAVVCEKLKSRDDTYQMGRDLESWGKSLCKP